MTEVRIDNLPRSITQSTLIRYFEQCGTVLSSKILHCKQTNKRLGVAYIRYESIKEATDATRLNHTVLEDNIICVSMAKKGFKTHANSPPAYRLRDAQPIVFAPPSTYGVCIKSNMPYVMYNVTRVDEKSLQSQRKSIPTPVSEWLVEGSW